MAVGKHEAIADPKTTMQTHTATRLLWKATKAVAEAMHPIKLPNSIVAGDTHKLIGTASNRHNAKAP